SWRGACDWPAARVLSSGEVVRGAKEEGAYVRCAEAGRVGAADREVPHRRPAAAKLVGEVAAEVVVVEHPYCRACLEVLKELHAADDRDRQLAVALVHVVVASEDRGGVSGRRPRAPV